MSLKRLIEGISSKVLTERLRRLEAEGIVFREHEPSVPPKVTYGLTEAGRVLDQAPRAFEQIAKRWGGTRRAAARAGVDQARALARRESGDGSLPD